MPPDEDYCENCGAFGPGREQWMFSSHGPSGKYFFCFRCLARMRLYAIIGFTLLATVLLVIVAVLWRLKAIP